MSDKIVVLNSGGFDSVVLMNFLHISYPDTKIHSVHFHYGARNEVQQQRCVDAVCKKCGAENIVIDLPKFSWTKGNFYSDNSFDYKTQYLEYRNLVFLSYAISYAESIGAKEVYLAILANGNYSDTNLTFLKGINSAIKDSGIAIVTPFEGFNKPDLLYFAITSGVKPEDYFSCDNPDKDGNPCGECPDCLIVKGIDSILTVDHPMKAFYQNGYDFSDKTFKELITRQPITEVRALINNDCQLHCKHCFYGFDNMVDEPLTREEYYSVLKELVLDFGVKNIHFSGKEPLFDDSILWYAERIQEDHLPCTFDLVTNGINVPKYAKRLKELGVNKLFLSVDDVLDLNGVRSVHSVTDKALYACGEYNIPVEIFIDLHENNFNRIEDIVCYLNKFSAVTSFYVRTIRSIGNASNQKLLNGEQLEQVFNQLVECSNKYMNFDFTFSISIEYRDIIFKSQNSLADAISICEGSYSTLYSDRLYILLEEFCSRYSGGFTFTPDGYFLGCASEVSCPNYDKVSVGNVRENTVSELIEAGRKVSYSCNDHFIGEDTLRCSCNFLSHNPLTK